jgi:hypothetical protein
MTDVTVSAERVQVKPHLAEVAEKINDAHRLAKAHAEVALMQARACGEALARVKASLPRGSWLPWLAANVEFSVRQAQRYMAAAQSEPTSARALSGKCDTVSYFPAASFMPEPGAMFALVDGRAYLIEQATTAGHFFVSSWWHQPASAHGDLGVEYLKRPIRADGVEGLLKYLGMAEPQDVSWRALPNAAPVSSALSMVPVQ